MVLQQLRLVTEWAAAHTSFYRDLLGGADSERLASVDDFFERVPVVGKSAVAARVDDFTDLSEIPTAIRLTGGTTVSSDAEPLLIFSSELVEEHRQRRMEALATREPGGLWPLHLLISNGSHGSGGAPSLPGMFTMPLRKPSQLDAILLLLRREFSFEGTEHRLTQLSGSLNLIKALTLGLQERGVRASELAVRHLAVSAWLLTPGWRELLEDYWECPVSEIYGLSEVPGLVCTRGSNDEPYRFAGPVFLELLDLELGRHIDSGVGRLVATPLLPLAAAQPILRYDTGDLVEMPGWSAAGLEREIRLHGRATGCHIADFGKGPRLLLSAVEVHSVLADVPEIAVEPYPESIALGLREGFGWPIYSIRPSGDSPRRLRLEIELSYAPDELPARTAELSETLPQALRDASPSLDAAIARGEVKLEVECRPPGAIGTGALV